MNEVKDRIPLGNGKSRKLYAPHLSSSMTFSDFLTLLKNGELYIDLNANDALTGDDIGVAQVGTKVNKALFESIAGDIAKIPNMLIGTLINEASTTTEQHTIDVPVGTNKAVFTVVFDKGYITMFITAGESTVFGYSGYNSSSAQKGSTVRCPNGSNSDYDQTFSDFSLNSTTGKLSFKLKQNANSGISVQTGNYSLQCYKQ